jgi:hypothetical protein
VIETLPGRRAEGDVAGEAAGTVFLECEPNVTNLSAATVGVEIRAFRKMFR